MAFASENAVQLPTPRGQRFSSLDLRPGKNLADCAVRLPIMSFFRPILTVGLALILLHPLTAAEESVATPTLEIVVSVSEQKLALMVDGEVRKKYAISTSRFGLGDTYGSYRTPLGRLKIREKIGDGLIEGSVLKRRTPTGEVLTPNAPGRDPIVSRILWLDGQEDSNRNAYRRCVYIHGTPDEKNLGRRASYGCIRMRSLDVIELYAMAPVGVDVSIVQGPLPGKSPLALIFSSAERLMRPGQDSRL